MNNHYTSYLHWETKITPIAAIQLITLTCHTRQGKAILLQGNSQNTKILQVLLPATIKDYYLLLVLAVINIL